MHPKFHVGGTKVNVQLPLIAIERTCLLVSDPAHLQPHNLPFFLFFIFLISFAFCGSGCGSGVGSLAKAIQSTNNTFGTDSTSSTLPTSPVTGSPSNTSSVTSVSMAPALGSIPAWKSIQFSAAVQGGATNRSVTMSALRGTITLSRLYTTPDIAGTDTITAVSNADSTKYAATTVSIRAAHPL